MVDAYQVFVAVNDIVWGPLMMVLLIGTGIFLTLRLKGLQARRYIPSGCWSPANKRVKATYHRFVH